MCKVSFRTASGIDTELAKRCIGDNSRTAQDQDGFAERYNGLVERYETTKDRAEWLQVQKAAREEKADILGAFMLELHERDGVITEFDDRLWMWTVEKVTAHIDGRLIFIFFNGQEITA